MFRRTRRATTANQLHQHLAEYDHLACSNPDILRLLIPEHEVWRFFIDSPHQPQGWVAYERREPGYLLALHHAFNFIYNLHTELTSDYIKELHHIACKGVSNTNYDNCDHPNTDQFRDETTPSIGFYLTDVNSSPNGLYEFLLSNFQTNTGQHISLHQDYHDPLIIDPVTINNARDFVRDHPNLEYLHRSTFRKIGSTKDLIELTNCLIALESYKTVQLRFESNQKFNVSPQLEAQIYIHITTYEYELSQSQTKLDKLRCIVKFIQQCEQTHPFADANCRTFCMLLLNHLLLKNGFPPTILKNPNRFDMFSTAELVSDVINGMGNVFKLIRSEKLFGVKTEDIIYTYTQFDQSPTTSPLSSFARCVEIESDARQRVSKRHKLP